MNQRRKTILFVIFILMATNLSFAMYDTKVGRFMQQDPLGYVDGQNLYEYVVSKPVDFLDPFGLLWKVDRNGGSKAVAKVVINDDTIEELANKIGLNEEEFKEWLTLTTAVLKTNNGDKNLGTLSIIDKICRGQNVKIPNIALMYWAGEVGGLGKQFAGYNDDRATLKRRGFLVNESSGLTAQGLIGRVGVNMLQKDLHGLYYWGHGFEPGYYSNGLGNIVNIPNYGAITDHYANNQLQREYKKYKEELEIWQNNGMVGPAPVSPSKNWDAYWLKWKNINPVYKFGFVIINTCFSDNQEAKDLVSDNGIFYGATKGVLVPTPFFIDRSSVANIIKPGVQDTKR